MARRPLVPQLKTKPKTPSYAEFQYLLSTRDNVIDVPLLSRYNNLDDFSMRFVLVIFEKHLKRLNLKIYEALLKSNSLVISTVDDVLNSFNRKKKIAFLNYIGCNQDYKVLRGQALADYVGVSKSQVNRYVNDVKGILQSIRIQDELISKVCPDRGSASNNLSYYIRPLDNINRMETAKEILSDTGLHWHWIFTKHESFYAVMGKLFDYCGFLTGLTARLLYEGLTSEEIFKYRKDHHLLDKAASEYKKPYNFRSAKSKFINTIRSKALLITADMQAAYPEIKQFLCATLEEKQNSTKHIEKKKSSSIKWKSLV